LIDEEFLIAAFEDVWGHFRDEGVSMMEFLEEHSAGFTERFVEQFRGAAVGLGAKEFEEEVHKIGKEVDLYVANLKTLADAKDLEEEEEFITALNDTADAFANLGQMTGKKFLSNIGKTLKGVSSLRTTFKAFPGAISKMTDAMTNGFATMRVKLSAALGVIGLILEAITAIISLFGMFGDEGEEEITRVEEAASELAEAFQAAFQELEDQIVEFVRTGKMQFKDLIDSLLEDLLRIGIRSTIIHPISSFFGFDNKGLSNKSLDPFNGSTVGGGIKSLPAMANASASSNVIINDQRSAGSPPLDVQQTGDGLVVTITEVVKDAVSSGRLDQSLRNTYGLKRRTR
jgi:hypothetical protein